MRFRRQNIRLPGPCYLGPQWYFLTACSQDRLPRFQDERLVASVFRALAEESETNGFLIQAYCFMPDHLHWLTNGTNAAADCLRLLKVFKQRSAYAFKQETGQRLWQHRVYDHILRNDERWEAVAYYIWMNPVRKGLCERPQDWPHSGSGTMDWQRLFDSARRIVAPALEEAGAALNPGRYSADLHVDVAPTFRSAQNRKCRPKGRRYIRVGSMENAGLKAGATSEVE